VREREKEERERKKKRERERERAGGGQLFCEHAVVRACRDAAVEISN